MTELKVDIPVIAKAYWPGLNALIGNEIKKVVDAEVRQLADQYYSQVVKHLGQYFIEKAEYIDGKLVITINPST